MKNSSLSTKFSARWSSLVGTAAVAALAACSSYAGEAFDPNEERAIPDATLQFEKINPAISMAHAYGNRGKGAHGSFGLFPANFETPGHTHTGAYHGVVIKGVMTNPFEGKQGSPELTAGSYWYVPAGMAHTTACISNMPCEFYFHADGAFDFTPIKK